MNVGAVGSGSQFNYASLNRTKLTEDLQKNPRYHQPLTAETTSGVTSQFGTGIDQVSLQKDLDFMEEYAASMTDLMHSANQLRTENRTGAMSSLEVSSSNKEVAEVSERMTLRNAMDLRVSVNQVAMAQQNVTQGIRTSSLASEDLRFSITDGSNETLLVDVPREGLRGVARTNQEQLNKVAESINSHSNFGVRAYVDEGGGTSSLHLQAKSTGVENSFHVSVERGNLLGLERERTEAQDAVYTVHEGRNRVEYRSPSNQVTLDFGRVDMKLKSAGEADISIQPDVSTVSDAFGHLVDRYNRAVTVLNQNSSRGTGVALHQRSFQQGLAPEATLGRMGVSTRQDGTLAFDKNVLESALKEEPQLTKQLLGGNHSISQAAFSKANAALRTSSESLINQGGSFGTAMNGMGAFLGSYSGLGLIIDYLV